MSDGRLFKRLKIEADQLDLTLQDQTQVPSLQATARWIAYQTIYEVKLAHQESRKQLKRKRSDDDDSFDAIRMAMNLDPGNYQRELVSEAIASGAHKRQRLEKKMSSANEFVESPAVDAEDKSDSFEDTEQNSDVPKCRDCGVELTSENAAVESDGSDGSDDGDDSDDGDNDEEEFDGVHCRRCGVELTSENAAVESE